MEDPTTDGLDTVAGVCKPVAASCPADYVCCSDDPATTMGRLPNYFNGQIDGTYGVPIFSGANNALSYSGQCVDVGGFPSAFDTGCRVPCNPTWAPAQVAEFCGMDATCCPFRALDPIKDCVLDPNTNLWRAVRGSDIPMLTTWGDKHTTNQDPQGLRELAIQAEPLVPAVVQRQQQRFLERWNEALRTSGAEQSVAREALQERALNEAAAFAISIDVAEELARLRSHLDEIERLLAKGGEIGKRLDFLIQELLREAITLGSKAAALELTNIEVDMKVANEQLREQVQNIE